MAGEVRDILVAVAGLTPQVITETLYYLTQVRRPPVVPAAVYVLTTRRGQACLLTHLLAPEEGRFFAFCREYGLEAAAIAVELQVLSDARGQPLDDIRTPEDSAAVADQIAALVARLAADPATRLHCSIAGGRKTQAVLLGFALQLYGRPQDTLLHVLVSEAAEAHPDFYYPPRTPQLLRARDGRTFDASQVRVDVAEIPFVRLRQVLGGEAVPGFDAATAQAQQALAALPVPGPLVVDLPQRCLHLGPHRVALPPLQLVLYAQLACLRQRGAGEDGLVLLEELEACREEMLQRYAALYGPHSGHVARLRRQWQHGLPRDTVRTHFAVINRRLRQAVLAPAELYTIASRRQYGRTRYGLRLPPAAIHLREN